MVFRSVDKLMIKFLLNGNFDLFKTFDYIDGYKVRRKIYEYIRFVSSACALINVIFKNVLVSKKSIPI